MKKLITFALALMLSGIAMAQSLQATASDYDRLQLTYTGTTLEVGQTTLFGEQFSTLTMGSAITTLNPGQPALPLVTDMVEVPLCEGFTYEVTRLVVDTLDLQLAHPLAPAQPSRCKSDRSEARLVMDAQTYQSDAFTGEELFAIERVGVARSKNLASVRFCPVQYNPVTGKLIVVKRAEVTVRFQHPDISGTQDLARHSSLAFAPRTLNSLPCTKDIASAQTAPIHYLIVAHSMFRGQLDQFVAWKQRKGFLVTVAYTDQPEVGTTSTSIAAYIKGFYTNATDALPAPSFLLLVGDCAQIPPHNGRWVYSGQSANQQVTDLYYTTWTTGDNIPDCYCGRFSAENVSQLTPQVEKTLMYEQYTFSDPSFLDRAILVAGVDNGSTSDNGYKFGDPAMDYAARYYVTPTCFKGGVTYYKNNTSFAPTGVTVTGSSQASATASALRTLYSQGAGWVNYTAHGDVTEWYNPSFTTSHVAQMTNREKFGVMIGNCCLTGKFDETCLGEALLRKDNYCGAVNYFGGSNVSYWYEDFYWSVGVRNSTSINNTMNTAYDAQNMGMYDRLFHTQGQPRGDWYTSAGAMMMAGNMAVQSSSSSTSAKNYYWEIYHCFGDPSVSPWLGQAQEMPVQASTALPIGSPSLSVQAVPYAYCALTDGQGTLIGAAFADASGAASIPTSNITAPGTFELAVSAQGYRTSFTEINVFVSNGPFVKVNSIEGTLVAGQQAQLTVELENIGTAATEELTVELIVDNQHLFLHQGGQQPLSNLAAGQSLTVSGIFTADVLPSVPDQTLTRLTAVVRWGTHSNEICRRDITLPVDAPAVNCLSSNFQGTIAAGQTVTLTLALANQGHADASGLQGTLLCLDPAVTVTPADAQPFSLTVGQEHSDIYSLALATDLPDGCVIPLFYTLSNGAVTLEQTISLVIGRGFVDDFESATLTAFPWQQGQYPWEITTNSPYAGTYCARSKTWPTSTSGNNYTSDMQISWTSTAADSISFMYKVSSESNYDFFYFYIDGQQKLSASGEVDWTRAAFPVTAGTHIFRFAYTKDYSQRSGSDCAWVDDVSLPLAGTGRVYTLDTLCQGDTYEMPTYTYTATQPGTLLLLDTTDTHLYFTQLTVYAAPELTLEADTTLIREGESVLLIATGADSYLWSTGATNDRIRVYPTETTTYSVEGRNGRCSTTASITIRVEGTIGIAEAEAATLRLYPNPTTGELRIENIELRGQTLELYDIQGRLVLRRDILDAPSATLHLTDLPNGIYLLRTNGQVHKVVKR